MLVNLVLANQMLGLKLSDLLSKGYKIDSLVIHGYNEVKDIDPRIGYISTQCSIILVRGDDFRPYMQDN